MALSDCSRCWDTPCECGNEGYMVLRTQTMDEYKRLRDLPKETFEKLQTFLQAIMLAALKPIVHETSGVELPTVDVDIQVVPLGKAETRCSERTKDGGQCIREKHEDDIHAWPKREPVCKMCNDTHHYDGVSRMVMCTHCPIPCDMCLADSGPYCASTPCPCPCHKPKES